MKILLLGVLLCGVLNARLIYTTNFTVIACGGSGQPLCSVQATVRTPTAGEQTGLTSANYVSQLNQSGWSNIAFTIRDSNSLGTIIGATDGSPAVHSQFVFRNLNSTPTFNCCVDDTPFVLLDVNENNIAVGQSSQLSPIYVEGPGGASNSLPVPSLSALLSQLGLPNARINAIDNLNQLNVSVILDGPTQSYDVVQGIPEPATFMLVGIPIIAVIMIRKR
jgi:hypothetical protein